MNKATLCPGTNRPRASRTSGRDGGSQKQLAFVETMRQPVPQRNADGSGDDVGGQAQRRQPFVAQDILGEIGQRSHQRAGGNCPQKLERHEDEDIALFHQGQVLRPPGPRSRLSARLVSLQSPHTLRRDENGHPGKDAERHSHDPQSGQLRVKPGDQQGGASAQNGAQGGEDGADAGDVRALIVIAGHHRDERLVGDDHERVDGGVEQHGKRGKDELDSVAGRQRHQPEQGKADGERHGSK